MISVLPRSSNNE